ncbi:MAG: asparagine synthase (glutamine-hydrolyzing) [Bacteroidetes bacterium]|nr:asparagine synthase (glutamine-hydrolyzing) [Bacteroidota bacterium]
MCGIAGIFNNKISVEPALLQKMGDTLIHRGPDNGHLWVSNDGQVGFAHRRLSIIDLSENADQPMTRSSRFTIVYNGEIYNYIELKKDLEAKGYQFKTKSDTEVLLALFEDQGSNCLQCIDGMFAFAIWDEEKKELFLARDRFGEKPLYYCIQHDVFYFASEMKALFSIGLPKNISQERIFKYLQSNVLIDEEDLESTFYTGIRQLDAACFLRIKNAVIQERKYYWNLTSVKPNNHISLEDAAKEFRRLFELSVLRRMRSDVTVGSSLSGGIDSSAIVLLANKYKNNLQGQNTFSARFKNFNRDEGKFIEKVIAYADNIQPYTVWPSAETFLAEIETLAYYQEEPFVSGSVYNQYCVMRLAKEHNTTVLLDGQGADEQLGGYIHYYRHHLTRMLTKNPQRFFAERVNYQAVNKEYYPYSIPTKLPLWYIKKIFLRSKYTYDADARSLLIKDTTVTGLKALLRYGDRNSMAFSREVRLPFLSHELSEFIFSLPIEYMLNSGWTKYILRKAFEDIVPPEITWRRLKIGFEPPQEDWVQQLKPLYEPFKTKTDYRDFTGGKKVTRVTDWKWLMLKLFADQ